MHWQIISHLSFQLVSCYLTSKTLRTNLTPSLSSILINLNYFLTVALLDCATRTFLLPWPYKSCPLHSMLIIFTYFRSYVPEVNWILNLNVKSEKKQFFNRKKPVSTVLIIISICIINIIHIWWSNCRNRFNLVLLILKLHPHEFVIYIPFRSQLLTVYFSNLLFC